MELQELTGLVSKMEKRVQALERENGILKQRVDNFHAEIFLPEVMAMYPDKTMRKRTTMKGVVDSIIQVINNKPKSKIITQAH